MQYSTVQHHTMILLFHLAFGDLCDVFAQSKHHPPFTKQVRMPAGGKKDWE